MFAGVLGKPLHLKLRFHGNEIEKNIKTIINNDFRENSIFKVSSGKLIKVCLFTAPCRNHTSIWVFSCKFAAYFQNTFSQEHLWRAASD